MEKIKVTGLSIPGIGDIGAIAKGTQKPNWLDFSKQVAALTGNSTIINLATGIVGLKDFIFRTPKWAIGGLYFDGIIRTEHASSVRVTEYPVQTGAVYSDHAVFLPQEVVIEVMMTDSMADSTLNLGTISLPTSIFTTSLIEGQFGPGDDRSIAAYQALKNLQKERMPITVETRLQTYENMEIIELSAPDDARTYNALKATVRLKEVLIGNVSEVVVSARAQTTAKQNTTGQTVPQVQNDKTVGKALWDEGKKFFGIRW